MPGGSRVYRIELPTPFPDGTANAYLLPGSPCTLVDCGVGGPETLAALSRVARAAGGGLADLRQIVLTHLHIDHIGGLREVLALAPEARVLIHVSAMATLRGEPTERARQRALMRRVLAEAGMPPTAGRRRGADPWHPAAERVAGLGDGDLLPAGGAAWRVLHTPGHSQSQICLHDAANARLLSSDHVMRDVAANAFIEPSADGGAGRPRALPEYRRELERVGKLQVRRVYPGHGAPFRGLTRVVARRLRQQDERCAAVLALLASGPRTAYSLAREMFPGLDPRSMFLGICQAIGHLDLLEDRGEVTATRRDGVIWYARRTPPPAGRGGARREAVRKNG